MGHSKEDRRSRIRAPIESKPPQRGEVVPQYNREKQISRLAR
eukprot:gene829-467_t